MGRNTRGGGKQHPEQLQGKAPVEERQSVEQLETQHSAPPEADLGAVVEQSESPIIDGLMAGGDDDGCEDVGPYRTGERVGTWHGLFADAALEAGVPVDAGAPLSEPLTREAAIALARTSGGAAVVLSDGDTYVVQGLVVASMFPFTSDALVCRHGDIHLTADADVEAIISEDGVLYEAHRFVGDAGEDAHFDRNDQPEQGASATAGIRTAHGDGLEDFEPADDGELSTEVKDEVLRTFEVALRDVALATLDVSEAEAQKVAADGNTEQLASVASQLADVMARMEAHHRARPSHPAFHDAYPMGSARDDFAGPMSFSEFKGRLDAHDKVTAGMAELKLEADLLIVQAPILEGLNAEAVQSIADGGTAAIEDRTTEVLAAIPEAREYVIESAAELWKVPRLVDWTKRDLGVDHPALIEAIDAHAAEVEAAEARKQVILTAASIGLGIVALAATWGLGAGLVTGAVGGVSAIVGAADFDQQLDIAAREWALTGTDLAGADQLVDPATASAQTVWLALALVGIGLDAADAISLIKLAKAGDLAEEGVELAIQGSRADPSQAADLLKRAGMLVEGDAAAAAKVKSALKADLPPEAAEMVDAAYRAADELDLEEVRRLHAELESGPLDKNSAHALWVELTDRIWARGLDTVDMAGETHTLRMGYEDGEFVLLLCSDCAALSKTLAWLRTHPSVTDDPGLLAHIEKLSRDVDAVAPDAVPDTSAIRATLEEIGNDKGIACLTCLADAPVAGLAGNFSDTLSFIGKTLDEAMADEAFAAAYQPYKRGGKQYVRRIDGPSGDFPELEVTAEGILTWRKAASRSAATKLDVSMEPVALLAELRTHSSSVDKLAGALIETLGWTPGDVAAHLATVAKTMDGEVSVDVLRHALKGELRPHLLADIVSGDAARSVELINALTSKLNSSDAGNIAEAWLLEHRKAFDGANPDDYLQHVGLSQEANPVMKGDRDADLARLGPQPHSEGQARQVLLNEVKSGSGPLSQDHDIPQIEDLLKATRDGAKVSKGGQGYEASQVVVTFTDVRKAKASVETLGGWLDEPHFAMEVFTPTGDAVRISNASLPTLLQRYSVSNLEELLDAIGRAQ